MRFAVFANPHASFFQTEGAMQSLYKITSGRGVLLTPTTDEEVEAELANLVEDEPQFIAVAGGDGTLSRFTTSLLRVWPHDRLPAIAVVQCGTMNTISKSMGVRGDPLAQLTAYSIPSAAFDLTQRWPLQVGDDRWGYLFGTGIIPRFIEAYEGDGQTSAQQAARTLARKVLGAFLGGSEAASFFAPTTCDVFVDGRPWPMKSWLLLAAGATHDLGLNFRPFPGLLQSPGKMGIFASASKPARFALDLLPFRFQRPARHSLAFHHIGDELRLQAAEPITYNLDGDLHTVGTSLVVRPGPPLSFLLPPDAKPPANQLGP